MRSILKEPVFFSLPRAPLGVGNSRQVLGINPPGYLDVNQEGDDGFMGVQPDLHSRVWSLQVGAWPWGGEVLEGDGATTTPCCGRGGAGAGVGVTFLCFLNAVQGI